MVKLKENIDNLYMSDGFWYTLTQHNSLDNICESEEDEKKITEAVKVLTEFEKAIENHKDYIEM
jgi:peptide methionine sulfoxide reductase MsrA